MSTTAWNLAELRTHIQAIHAEPQPILELVDSIDRSVRIFRYHMATARDALKGLVNEENPAGKENFLLVLGASKQQEEFEHAKVVSEAHIIGCLHTARSLLDVFSQLVNVLLLVKPLPVGACDFKQLTAALPNSGLKARLEELLTSHWYSYLAAFINTTKHRQLVRHLISMSVEENRVGIQIGAFSYSGRPFKAYWGNEVLEGAIGVKNSIIACGRLLNSACVGGERRLD
jgi:hypothetical protein